MNIAIDKNAYSASGNQSGGKANRFVQGLVFSAGTEQPGRKIFRDPGWHPEQASFSFCISHGPGNPQGITGAFLTYALMPRRMRQCPPPVR
jgi:hypothetical protein